MDKNMLIEDAPYLSSRVRSRMHSKNIRRLSDLNQFDVRELWKMTTSLEEFKALLHLMKVNRLALRDVDVSRIDLLANDIKELKLSVRARNVLYRRGARSLALLQRLTISDVKDIRNLGPKGFAEVQAALAARGIELKEEE